MRRLDLNGSMIPAGATPRGGALPMNQIDNTLDDVNINMNQASSAGDEIGEGAVRQGDEAGDTIENVNHPINRIPLEERPYSSLGTTQPCFPAGTIIKTPDGDKVIECIKEGDVVFAYDTTHNKVVTSLVEKTFKNWTDYLVTIEFDEKSI